MLVCPSEAVYNRSGASARTEVAIAAAPRRGRNAVPFSTKASTPSRQVKDGVEAVVMEVSSFGRAKAPFLPPAEPTGGIAC
jgi:hypothetical protein